MDEPADWSGRLTGILQNSEKQVVGGGVTAIHKDLGMSCRAGLPATSKSSAKISTVSSTWTKQI